MARRFLHPRDKKGIFRMTDVDVFIRHMLDKPNSKLVIDTDGVTCIEIAHFDHG